MSSNTDVLVRDIKKTFKELNSSSSVRNNAKYNLWKAGPSKSTAMTETFREAGNKFYEEKNLNEALLLYTKSVAHAPNDSNKLSKAYGNRSAVLFELAQYVPCLLDINRALNSHCPYLLSQKLRDRKERCVARIKLSTSIGSSADNKIDEDATSPMADQEPMWRSDMLSNFKNQLLPNTSPKIQLKYDEKWGRHFVATADIEPGEALISENYFVIAFSDDNPFKYCDFCVKLCLALIPCFSCARTMYCSEQCRTRAHDSYHRVECKLSSSSSTVTWNNGPEVIAIRMFLIGTEQGAALENLMNTLTIPDIFVENFDFTNKSVACDYLTALRLTQGNFDSTHHVKTRITYAVNLVTALRRSGFFKSVPFVEHTLNTQNRLKDAEVFAAALFLKNFSERLHLNTFSSPGCKFLNIERSLHYGILLLHYLFNHSCYPNIYFVQRGRENIAFAIRPIKKDEQIFYAYFDDFVHAPKAQRVQRLNFSCRCEACSHNWPTRVLPQPVSPNDILRPIIEGLIPLNEREYDRVLRQVVNVADALLDDTTLISLRVDEIISIIGKLISQLHEVMSPWSFSLVELGRCLRFFMKLYYFFDVRECRQNQDESFTFPESVHKNDNILTILRRTMPTKSEFYLQAVTKLLDVIRRLNFYMMKADSVQKKEIVG